jgi:hypothetical protein
MTVMTTADLASKVAAHEDNFVERKPAAVKSRDIAKTVVGFANSVPEGREAILFIGVRDNGDIEGCVETDSLQKTILEICSRQCYPPIQHRCEVVTVHGKSIVAVVVPSSSNGPHFAGITYVRQGSQTVQASDPLFEDLILRRTSKTAALTKMRNQVVTVHCLNHVLGETGRIGRPREVIEYECRVLDIDAHRVRLQIVAAGRYASEPLEAVSVSYDENRYRPLLIVRPLL